MKDQISVSDKTRLNIPIANFVVIVSIITSVYGLVIYKTELQH